MKISVLLVDDFPLAREGLAAVLEGDPAIAIVGQAENGHAAIERAIELKPDVVVLDIKMPGLGGIAVIERLRTEAPDARVLVLTASERAETLLDAVAAGAAGYLTKRASQEELCQAVITVHGGGSIISPHLAPHLLREYALGARGEPSRVRPLLTRRERDVLRLVTRGLTDREIGEQLYISPRTVQNQLASIRTKTGLRRRSELVRWALEHMAT